MRLNLKPIHGVELITDNTVTEIIITHLPSLASVILWKS